VRSIAEMLLATLASPSEVTLPLTKFSTRLKPSGGVTCASALPGLPRCRLSGVCSCLPGGCRCNRGGNFRTKGLTLEPCENQ
jgi:hypothetical protein